MKDRKYRFRRPATPDECIEAVYEEVTRTTEAGSRQEIETLKDNVVEIVDLLRREKWERQDLVEAQNYSVSWALGALAILAGFFLWHGFTSKSDVEWLAANQFAIKLWGVAFAAVFLGVSIERTSFFRSLWAFGFTKVIASIAVSALILVSTGKAAGIMNSVFPVDASALPLTRALVTGILAFKYSYPVLGVVAIFAIFHAFGVAERITSMWSKREFDGELPLQSLAFLFLSLVFLVFANHWVSKDFSEQELPSKVYRLAHALDFNSKYECANLRKGLSVVFLGPDQARVLVDVFAAQTDDVESFVDRNKSGQISIPRQFYILPCEPSSIK